jgi:hypothetical protein
MHLRWALSRLFHAPITHILRALSQFVHAHITDSIKALSSSSLSLAHYLASRTFPWAGHVTRMTKNRAPKRLMLPWVGKPRIAGGQEMTYARSLERHVKHVGLEHADGSALAFTEWATLVQDRVGWRTLVTKPPFDISQPHVRQLQCDTRVSPEYKRRFFAQRAAEAEQRRALFNAAVVADTP